jgi:hypothetical protein
MTSESSISSKPIWIISLYLEKYYDVTVDLEGKEYVKIELDWDYENKRVHLSMAPYLQKALRHFDNVIPTKRQDSPYPYIEPKYGAKQQFAECDRTLPVGKKNKSMFSKCSNGTTSKADTSNNEESSTLP